MRQTTDRETFRAVAREADSGARVPVEARLSVSDPFEAYRRARDGPGGAVLETTGGQSGWSYFAVDPVERLQVGPDAILADRGAERSPDDYRRATPTLAALDGLLAGEQLERGDCEVPFPCGAIGWLSYDIARELEDLPNSDSDDTGIGTGAVDDRGLPRLQLAVFDTVAAWEEPRDGAADLHLTTCPAIPDAADDAALDRLFAEAVDELEAFAERIESGDDDVEPAPVASESAEFESDCGRDAFADRVRRVKEYVREGDTFQANVSQRLVAPAAVHPVDAFDAVRRVNPAPYSGLLEFGWGGRGVDLVSASPELLLERDADRLVTEPIAGTRPRGETAPEDERLEAELAGDEKERAEHAMLVDLERNDLGKVSEYGSVDVEEHRRVDRYSEVMHLVSVVTGTERPDHSLADTVAAAFPGGTITGAPKPRTMEIIDELEGTRRGPYTGSMAAFGFDGHATLNIVIRTLVRTDDRYHLRVGAGIVHDSDPVAEYEETLDKARALVNAVDEALEVGDLAVER